MIAVVAESIMQVFKNSQSLQKDIGDLYFQQAPQDIDLPYGVFYINGYTQEELMGSSSNNITQFDIQFSLFSDATDGGEQIATMIAALNDAYHWKVLLINGWRCLKMARETVLPLLYIDETWQASIDYSLWIQEE